MTEGEKTFNRLVAERPDPRTDPNWWLGWITLINLASLAWLAKAYWPIIRMLI